MAGDRTVSLRQREGRISRIHQILLVGLFGRPAVQTQVVAASGIQTLMPQDLLDVSDGAAVQQ